MPSEPRRRVVFAGHVAFDLPLPEAAAAKWDAVSERLDVRVLGVRGDVRARDPRFVLAPVPPRLASPWFHATFAARIRRSLGAFAPDAVVAQSPLEGAHLRLAAPGRTGRPALVVEVHGDWRTAGRLYGSPARHLLAGAADGVAARTLRSADAVRAVGRATARLAEDVTGRPPEAVFPGFIDVERFFAVEPSPFPAEPTVLWVGALQGVKGPDVLARAWPSVARAVPEARLVVVGDGPQRDVLEPLAAVHHPRLDSAAVARAMDEATLLVLPSRSEGLGRVAIEAHARGRPVVGSDVGGIPDVVAHGRTGLVFPSGDAGALAAAIVELLRDRELARRFGAQARRDAERHRWSPERWAAALADLVEVAIQRRSARS